MTTVLAIFFESVRFLYTWSSRCSLRTGLLSICGSLFRVISSVLLLASAWSRRGHRPPLALPLCEACELCNDRSDIVLWFVLEWAVVSNNRPAGSEPRNWETNGTGRPKGSVSAKDTQPGFTGSLGKRSTETDQQGLYAWEIRDEISTWKLIEMPKCPGKCVFFYFNPTGVGCLALDKQCNIMEIRICIFEWLMLLYSTNQPRLLACACSYYCGAPE